MLKRIKQFILAVIVILGGFLIVTNVWVVLSTSSLVHNSLDDVPTNEVALVLGTSNRLRDGSPNPFFRGRIQTAVDLINSKKVKNLIVSGDNNTIYYNEPVKMQTALLAKEIPENIIRLDYAGFRTLDSVVRCKEVFGESKITIVTQGFHAYRALFIANYYGMDAVAMAAPKVPFLSYFPVILREYLARPKAVLDLYVFNKGPKFL